MAAVEENKHSLMPKYRVRHCMKSHVIINNLLIQYYVYGKRDFPSIIFLHGWRAEGTIWNDIATKLSRDFNVHALDLPGFGGSSAPTIPFTISDYADIVSGFMKKMKIKKSILVGHSFGGRIAIKISATKPKLVKKLVLIDSAGFADKKRQGMKFLAKLVKPLFAPAWMQGMRTRIYKMIRAEDYLATPVLQKTFVNIVEEDLSDDVSRIHAPTLLLWGENDTETPMLYGRKMHEKIQNSQLVVLSGAGHFSFLDKPIGWYTALTNFLK